MRLICSYSHLDMSQIKDGMIDDETVKWGTFSWNCQANITSSKKDYLFNTAHNLSVELIATRYYWAEAHIRFQKRIRHWYEQYKYSLPLQYLRWNLTGTCLVPDSRVVQWFSAFYIQDILPLLLWIDSPLLKLIYNSLCLLAEVQSSRSGEQPGREFLGLRLSA